MLLLLFSVAGKPRAREKHKRLPAWLFFPTPVHSVITYSTTSAVVRILCAFSHRRVSFLVCSARWDFRGCDFMTLSFTTLHSEHGHGASIK